MATAIQTRSDVNLAAVKDFLDISGTAHDSKLTTILAGVKSLADIWVDNDFLDDDGENEDIPPYIDRWILRKVAAEFNHPESGVVNESAQGIGSITLTDEDKKELLGAWSPYF